MGFCLKTAIAGYFERLLLVLIVVLVLAALPVSADAVTDLPLLEPVEYERLKGKPTVYTETFERCEPSDLAHLRVWNGDSRASRITAAEIFVNGQEIFSENEFKQKVDYLEKAITVERVNELKVVLKSGDYKVPAFLRIGVLGKNCDDTPPTISALLPADGSLHKTSRPLIGASFVDNPKGSGIDSASLRLLVDGRDVTGQAEIGDARISYTPRTDLPEGEHRVVFEVADRAFNQASGTWNFTTDTIAPLASITSLHDGQFINTPTLGISGSVDDPSATVTVNGRAAVVSGNSFALDAVTLVELSNTLVWRATDPAGNSSTGQISVNLDTIPPQPVILSPLQDSYTNILSTDLSGSADEPLVSVTVTGAADGTDGIDGRVDGNDFNLAGIALREGLNRLAVTVFDRAGNSGSAEVSLYGDTQVPTVTITAPQNGLLTNIAQVAVAATVDEPIVFATVNGLPATIDGQSIILNTCALTEGHNRLHVAVIDRAGNPGEAGLSVTLDSIPPQSPVIDNLTGPTNIALQTVSGRAEPGTVVRLFQQQSTDGEPSFIGLVQTDGEGRFILSDLFLTEGENLFTATATDAAGNQSTLSKPVSLVLDTIAPEVSIVSPLADVFLNNPILTVNGTFNEALAELRVNGQLANRTGNSYLLNGLSLSEGTNSIVVSAIDLAGNKGTAVATVNLDTRPPVVTIVQPDDGLLTNEPLIVVAGKVDEIIESLTVNGQQGQVSELNFSSGELLLLEGDNALSVTATDRAGNVGNAIVRVRLDATAPTAPTLSPLDSPTNRDTIDLIGRAEPGSVVELSALAPAAGEPVVIASINAAESGDFSLADYSLLEGSTRFSAVATDAAGNRSEVSAILEVVLDTQAPAISILEPLDQSVSEVADISLIGTVDDPTAALVVDGIAVELAADGSFTCSMTLKPGPNAIILLATDQAGNTGTGGITVHVDSTPPVVTIATPRDGLLTNVGQLLVSGSVNEPVSLVRVGNRTLAVEADIFSGMVDLQSGANRLTVEAIDLAGNRGQASVDVYLDDSAPLLSLGAPAEAAAGESIGLQLGASDNRELALLELAVDGQPFWSVGSGAGSLPQLDLPFTISPETSSGSSLNFTLHAYDSAGNLAEVASTVTITQGPSGPGYLQGEVYDDTTGLLLENAIVVARSADLTLEATTTSDGRYLFEVPADDYRISVTRPGFTTVERSVTLVAEQTLTVLDTRLTPLAAQPSILGFDGGTLHATVPLRMTSPSASIGSLLELTVVEAALAEDLDLRLTPLGGQGLAALLPSGWSPVGALQLDIFASDGQPLSVVPEIHIPATARVIIAEALGIEAGSEIVVVRYDAVNRSWLALDPALVDSAGRASFKLSAGGQYALVLPDPGAIAPPSAQSGQPLQASTGDSFDPQAFSARGEVVPPIAPPAENLQVIGEVILNLDPTIDPAGQLSSGTVLVARVTEKFDLFSGEVIQPAAYQQDLIFYRYPCATGFGGGQVTTELLAEEVRTTFPVTPSRQYSIIELMMGKVGIEINPPAVQVGGVLAGNDGATLLDGDGNSLNIPSGALTQRVPVTIQTLDRDLAAFAVGNDMNLIRALDIDLSRQQLNRSAILSVPLPEDFDPARPVLLTRAFETHGLRKLRLVGLMRPVGRLLQSVTQVSAALTLDGIVASGSYYAVQAAGPLGFVQGGVSGAAGPFAAALVRADTTSIADLTTDAGRYVLPVPLTGSQVEALDLGRYDSATGAITLSAVDEVVTLDLAIAATPPRIVSISPAAGETGVEPNAAIILGFSEPVERATIDNQSISLRAPDGEPLAGAFSFSPDGKVVSFYPAAALASETLHTLSISGSIQDLHGYRLGADQTSSFTVRDITPPPRPPAGAISASFPDAEGYVTVTATQGSAGQGDTVLLLNDNSGEILSVSPESDGSFSARILAQLSDEIQVLLMDEAGNQTLISYLTYKAPDGRYLVTTKGGKVEGEGGLLLEIPEGALVGPTIVKISPVVESALPHPVPEGGNYINAVDIDTGGVRFQKEVELSVPLPAGYDQDNQAFVAQPIIHENADGTTEEVYEIIDTAKVIDGRLVTASPPFSGIYGFGIYSFLFTPVPQVAIVSGTTYRDTDGVGGYTPGVDLPVRNAVIRSSSAWNYITYSGQNGFYSFLGDAGSMALTATHPLTMQRVTRNLYFGNQFIAYDVNLKLADADTVPLDSTPPVIDVDLSLVPNQPPENRFVAGTVPSGTEIEVPISIIDQELQTATLSVEFKTPDMSSPQILPVTLSQQLKELHTPLTGEKPALYRYRYAASFDSSIAAGDNNRYFHPESIGVWTLKVEARDEADNRSTRQIQLRTIELGNIPDSIDGPPVVDEMLPGDGAEEVMVTTPLIVTFSEPVTNVDETTIYLVNTDSGSHVPATVYTSIEGGRMRATLEPRNNLLFDQRYELVVSSRITDSEPNSSADGGLLPLDKEYRAAFKTKVPQVYDLAEGQFGGGRDIDIYTDMKNGKTYAYVTAGYNGYRVVDITDPTMPRMVGGTPDSGPALNTQYRGVSVDQEAGILGITEFISVGASQRLGFVRFYDLSANPAEPVMSGREKLGQDFSGIPGAIDIADGYAFVATVGAGLQVVDIAKASEMDGPTDGSSIVGVFDTIGQNYGHPNDVHVYKGGRAVVTTNPGDLLVLNVGMPQYPSLLKAYKPEGAAVTRAGVEAGYSYTDNDGLPNLIDLALIGTRDARLHTLDLTDPYSPRIMGTLVDENGAEVMSYVQDVTINRDAKLAFVTSFSSIQIVDISDPYHPLLLHTLTNLPDDNGNLLPIGTTPAIVEKDGWVYMASDADGMRVLDLDPVYLKFYCGNEEFDEAINATFCRDYYPALGIRNVVIQGFDANNTHFTSADTVVVRLVNKSHQDVDVDSVKVQFNDEGLALFKVNYQQTDRPSADHVAIENNYFELKFQIDRDSVPRAKWNDDMLEVITVGFNVRNNANVTLDDVLKGRAVYVYDENPLHAVLTNHQNSNKAPADEVQFDFVQEMLNQVVSRKRELTVNVAESDEPQAYEGYSLLVEDGLYSPEVVNHVKLFKENFNIGDKTGPYTPGITPYSKDKSLDNTSNIFRKLMKDYGQRREAAEGESWLVDVSFIGKVIDKNTLVGSTERITEKTLPLNGEADYLLNGAAENNRHDTGLYELYRNVVERFVDGMIVEAERYAGIVSEATVGETPTPQWYSRGDSKTSGYGPTGCIDTGDDKECAGSHGTGMSYSYGGKQKVGDFNATVSAFKAPKNEQYETVPDDYKGDLHKKGTVTEGKIGAVDEKKKWAGLINTELSAYYAWLNGLTKSEKDAQKENHKYYKSHWAGIDCMGLVLRSIGAGDAGLSGMDLPTLCYTDADTCNASGPLGSDYSISNLSTSIFNSVDKKYSKDAYHRMKKKGKELKLIKKGDLVLYDGHISIVYSERWGESKYKATKGTDYDVIHAYGGGKTSRYSEKIKDKPPIFARKVMVTGADISNPSSFGRIKIWQ
jgi:hypothetical protein